MNEFYNPLQEYYKIEGETEPRGTLATELAATITRLEAENARLEKELEELAKAFRVCGAAYEEKTRVTAAEAKLAEAVKILKSVLADGHGYGEIHILFASLKPQQTPEGEV